MTEFSHKIVSRSSTPIIPLADAKLHLRVDEDDDDSEIERMVNGVAGYIEKYLQRFLLDTGIEESIAGWCLPFELRFHDVQAITKVEYYDSADAIQLLGQENYSFQKLQSGTFLVEQDGAVLPDTFDRPDPVKVTYNCGFGTAPDDIPAEIIDAAFLLLSDRYDRGSEGESLRVTADGILTKHRVF